VNGVVPNWPRDEHFTNGAGQPLQEIPLEQVSNGALARMWSDLGIGAPAAPGGGVRVAAAWEPWNTRAAWATMAGWLVMTVEAGCCGGCS
jgi:hypothetical protein